jgi:hypothetical protein
MDDEKEYVSAARLPLHDAAVRGGGGCLEW